MSSLFNACKFYRKHAQNLQNDKFFLLTSIIYFSFLSNNSRSLLTYSLCLLMLICANKSVEIIKRLLQFNGGGAPAEYTNDNAFCDLSQVKLQELLTFTIEKLVTATNKFHPSNKLGQGGFGPVYMVLNIQLTHI